MTEQTANTVHVVLLSLSEPDDKTYKQFYDAASDERRWKADRYRRHDDAVRCIMAEALVRYVYASTGKRTEAPEFVYPPRGKPYLQNDRAFHFSVSHTGMLAAVGYAEGEIGIDLEQIDRPLDRKSIADSVFTAEEQAYVFELPDEQTCSLRFAELWTAKESYLKYLGCGFCKNPLSFSVDLKNKSVHEKECGTVPRITLLGDRLPENYYLTVCGNIRSLSLKFVTYRSVMDVILK